MFESLNKMVEIHDDMLSTIDPFAYTREFDKSYDSVEIKSDLPALPLVCIFNGNFLTNRHICIYLT